MTLSVPSKPEELTANWLTEALHEMGYLLGDKVDRVALETLDPTLGAHSTLVRLHLEFGPVTREFPSTIIAKIISSNPAAADRLRRRRGDLAETCFYQQIRESIGLRIPTCLYSQLDEATGRYVILLEDLSIYRHPRARDGLSHSEISSVVRSLANSHAAWWDSPRFNELTWLPSLVADSDGMRAEFQAAWPILVERLGKGVPGLELIGERLTRTFLRAQERLGAAPVTFLHLDVRQENLFFAGPDENPTPILIDWQTLRRGRGAAGLASFLTFLPQRARLEETLLELYHGELNRAGIHDYSYEDCVQDYRMGVLRRFAGPVGALGTIGPDNPQGTALLNLLSRFELANLERHLDLLSNI